ncbi:MAG: thioredoxin-disulfide reductase [Candidatus Latescibacterota bacterium]|nr:MAG: thioredoxin-disulfide reductase [Candidatus Latescibacterota bacterium]
MTEEVRKVIILGSGPAGMTAAIYAARANLEPLVLEGIQPGGQLMITTDVENFPGFAEGVAGPELMEVMKRQAQRFGTEFEQVNVERVEFQKDQRVLHGGGKTYRCRALIISTGASARWLGLESEKRLQGHGVSACATCDGFFFKDKEIAVVGGGDTAMEEANFLTKFGTKIYVIHRRDKLRASKTMQERAFKNPKIEFVWDSVVTEILGSPEEGVQGVRVKNVKTGEENKLSCQGYFAAIGHTPNTQIFEGLIDMDEAGYILTKPFSTHTSVPGVFAAGDVQDKKYRQAVTAAGTGCMAALDAERYLEELALTE